MASNVKNIAKSRMMSGDMDLNSDDLRLFLCMTSTTFDTDVDTDNTGSYTLDEMDGSGYVRQNLANEAVNVDDGNDRAEFSADPVVFAAMSNGARQIQGAGIHEFITNDAGSFPLCWVEFTSTINPGGSVLTITWNAEGIVQLT